MNSASSYACQGTRATLLLCVYIGAIRPVGTEDCFHENNVWRAVIHARVVVVTFYLYTDAVASMSEAVRCRFVHAAVGFMLRHHTPGASCLGNSRTSP